MNRRQEVEAWWPLISRVAAFILGGYLIYQQAQPPPGVEEWIVMAGVGMMGPTVATAVASVVEAARGGGPPAQGGTESPGEG
jgi:hypothetical protein